MNPPLPDRNLSTRSRKRLIKLLLVAIALLYVVSLFVPVISLYTSYPLYVLKCGHQPIIASTFAASNSYVTPDSPHYGLSPFDTEFFCTEAEAQRNGYHKSPF